MNKYKTNVKLRLILIGILLLIIIPTFMFAPRQIHVWGYSMKPAINDGDNIEVIPFETFKMLGNSIKSGDVIVVSIPDVKDHTISIKDDFNNLQEDLKYRTELSVKRVVAEEGDTVSIKGGLLYVNDELVEHNYLGEEEMEEIICDGYFLLGDNPYFSMDSRYYGCIRESEIKYVIMDQSKYKMTLGGL